MIPPINPLTLHLIAMSPSTPPADFYHPSEYVAEESVGLLLRRVLNLLKLQTDRCLEPYGLTYAQWEPLLKLNTGRASTVATLASEMQADVGGTTRMLDRLEAKGLCKRVRSTEDRRVVNIELTPDGIAAASKVPAALAESMNAQLAGFSHAEWQTLLDYLRRMVANGEAMRSPRSLQEG